MRSFVLILPLFVAAVASAADTTHYLDLVNTAKNSITAVGIATAGGSDFREIPLGRGPLHGGGDSTTLAIRDGNGGCLHDLRIEFSTGRVLIQKNFDVCKYRTYHTGQYLHGQAQTVVASTP